jgi:hypothetical protein
VTRLVTPAVPAASRVPCRAPVVLPDRDLTAGETITLWGRDRAELRICETRRAAAVMAATTIPSLEPASD